MRTITKTKLSYLINIPIIKDEGYLCFMEESNHIPFKIKRVYYIFDTIGGAVRGMHAHKKTRQLIFCLQGSVDLILDDGVKREKVILNKANKGLFLDRMIWHEMINFRDSAILLVVASDFFKESDYIRKYELFVKAKNK